jgi:cell division protein FtsQ
MLWRRQRRGGIAGAHERFQRRVAAVRARRWKVTGLAAAFLALLLGTVYLFGFSPVFVVEDVVVEGAEDPLALDVRERAAVPLERPLGRVDTGRVESRVLGDLRVADVDVSRLWPSTVRIVVTPREPALGVAQPGEPMRVADAEGVVYQAVPRKPQGLPQVTLSRGAEVDPELLRGALSMRESLDGELQPLVRGIRVLPSRDLQFQLGELLVVWGPPEQPTLKARVLQALLANEHIDPAPAGDEEAEALSGARDRVTIDLRAPETPTVTGLPEAPEEE